jgi:hypothetical protein
MTFAAESLPHGEWPRLAHPGLPQPRYHPLSSSSSSLFLFVKANLVQNVINAHQGLVAFVNDYSAWVTETSAEENTRKIQERFISKA